MMFAYLLDTILPFFAIGALGFLLGRRGNFDVSMAVAINKFVMHVAVPALIISFMSEFSFTEINFRLLGGYLFSEVKQSLFWPLWLLAWYTSTIEKKQF